MEKEKRKLLLVDDEENNLSFMVRCLHGEPYDIQTCLNAIDALELAKKTKFDIILSDHKMPNMDGLF